MGALLAKLHIRVVTASSSSRHSSFISWIVPKKPLVLSTLLMMFLTAWDVKGKVLFPVARSLPENWSLCSCTMP